MKKNKLKLLKYSSATGALLAIAGGAHAAIQSGTIISGPGGDAILDQPWDYVLVDMDNDENPDFVIYLNGYLSSGSLSIKGTYSSDVESPALQKPSYSANNLVDWGTNSADWPFVKKFDAGELIGPLNGPSSNGGMPWGRISDFSGSGDKSLALDAPFSNPDDGYIGVSIWNSGITKYGWIKVNLNDSNEATVEACALESDDLTPIAAGFGASVPLLPIASAAGLGLIGLMAAMKKRKQKRA